MEAFLLPFEIQERIGEGYLCPEIFTADPKPRAVILIGGNKKRIVSAIPNSE